MTDDDKIRELEDELDDANGIIDELTDDLRAAERRAGAAIDPEAHQALADAVRDLLLDMGLTHSECRSPVSSVQRVLDALPDA